ncbi:hypothetical protein PNP85_13175, partial [Halobacterium salinarum]|uniref:hypothetical protein n=1 Tax=Halobacterium salinarum TaxID=2242 RepID=UPI002554C5B0
MIGYKILQEVYNNTIRSHLPIKYRLLAGVAVPDAPLLDFTADKREYKKGLMSAIVDGLEEGNRVDLVGFGRGVSTVRAFDAGAEHVTAYEAAEEMISLACKTVDVNRPFDPQLSVEQAIVGDPIEVYGDDSNASVQKPENLSDADVLILDCEGSELSIIDDLGSYPRTIICETHPERGVPTDEVLDVIPGE